MKFAGIIAAVSIFTIMPFTLARSVFFGTFLGSGLMILVLRSWSQRFLVAGCLLYSFLLTFLDKFIFARMILSFFDPSLGAVLRVSNGSFRCCQVREFSLVSGPGNTGRKLRNSGYLPRKTFI